MTKFSCSLIIPGLATLGCLLSPTVPALSAPTEAADFALLDQHGELHRLHYYSKDANTRAIVLFVQGNGCPLVRKQVPELKRLRSAFASQGVKFWMINANPQDTRAEIAAESAEFEMDFPVLKDESQIVARTLEIRRTAEVLVIDPANWQIRYRGAVDDRFSYGSRKSEAEHSWLKNSLEALLAGNPVNTTETRAAGCAITFPDPDVTPTAYRETIAPLLKQNCVGCHTKGGIGPFAMSSYEKVNGWSDMIREVLMTRRMPPWQADPHVGHFGNDFSLTPEQTTTLVQWIDAGAPRGEGEDPLVSYRPELPEWQLGPPDFVVEIPEQKVEAEGVFDYRYVVVDAPNQQDVWLRGLETLPGNKRVLHHIIASAVPPGGDIKKDRKALTGYAPGMGPDRMPEGTGILLKAGSKIVFQMHYTASGKAETDRSRLGFYRAGAPPAKELHSGVLIDHKVRIPPGDRAFAATKSRTFDKPVLLYSMNPHMHLRGKSMRYTARYPDGTEEVLLNVPDYRFDWQHSYELKEPKPLPAGTQLSVKAVWDNSALNLNNPDPSQTVGWGDQTFNEMFYASFSFTDAEVLPPPAPRTAAAEGIPKP